VQKTASVEVDPAIGSAVMAQARRVPRFEFGANWERFLASVDDERIERAVASLRSSLRVESLAGKTFLDVGSGSGLFSLAARTLGATVHSFDYDPKSVACTMELRRRYFPGDGRWAIEEGSVLDGEYLASLGMSDVVYSWGVLHHTGDMWAALENVGTLVAPGGALMVAIYNDQGVVSSRWFRVKRLYVCGGLPGRWAALMTTFVVTWGWQLTRDFLKLRGLSTWAGYKKVRGMSAWRDVVDWAGGYPFQVAKPEEVFDFFKNRGFALDRINTCGSGKGCNEFVFSNNADSRRRELGRTR
jgi:2-polyprenyl-6-hydroxyphenyl methylase/3-demethylubiquinone-9 3-methyltransferase